MSRLARLLADAHPAPFALLHRPAATGPDTVELLTGEISTVKHLADLPEPTAGRGAGPRHSALAVVPFRQAAERGFEVVDDGCPLLALLVDEQEQIPRDVLLDQLPDLPVRLSEPEFDLDDAAYGELVRQVQREAIGGGHGANFVLRRSMTARIDGYTPAIGCSLFRRLLQRESGAYWTFLVHTGESTFVGASPECHVSLSAGLATMNPISGTYPYPRTGPDLPGILGFLSDTKEAEELSMVLEEELKMMATVCEQGGRARGPMLRQMSRLAHTEYRIEGRTAMDPREVLRRTLFSPAVTGSPVESSFRTIRDYEPAGRGYYAGVVALLGADAADRPRLDSAIVIRTAQIERSGRLTLGVGATIVRHSVPATEAAETRAKAEGLLRGLDATAESGGPGTIPREEHVPVAEFGSHPDVRAALSRRNESLAGFWIAPDGSAEPTLPQFPGPRGSADRGEVLVLDAQDSFSAMLAQQIRALGLRVRVGGIHEPVRPDRFDLLVCGPGPGDPRNLREPRMARLAAALGDRLDSGRPLLAVCLSHQVLGGLLGLETRRRPTPNQGLQREIDLFGDTVRVGFYNSFSVYCAEPEIRPARLTDPVEVCRDPATGEVHALRGTGFHSFQFHPESVLSADGMRILASSVAGLLHSAAGPDDRGTGHPPSANTARGLIHS